MAEPQRKYTPDIDPEIRPNLRAINGGGESTSSRGNLSGINTDRINDAQDGERNFQVIDGGGEGTSERGDLSSVDEARSGEKAPFINRVTGNQNEGKSRFSARGIIANRKWLASIGVIGVAGSLIAVFMTLLPLKLEMFISNITQSASAVPGYAVEQRTEYIVTRALATRLLMKANGGMDTESGKIAFCGNSSIACSLWLTYSSDYFEKKLGITFEADGRGRAKLGGKAQSWDIKATGEDGRSVDGIVQRITSNSEMRAFLKTEVKKNNNKNIVTRYIGRKILMKKYGVRNFNGPKKLEETRNSYNTAKTNLKAKIIANTMGKVSPRIATYLTCIQGGATCAELLRKGFNANGVDFTAEDPGDAPSNGDTQEVYEKKKEKYERAQAANNAISSAELGEVSGDSSDAVRKFISSKVVKIAGGSLAGAGLLDLIFGAVGAIDDGALEEVWYDIATQSYVGFAYEDIIVTNEKMKAGDIDMANLQAATELMDGAEESTLQQAENGGSAGLGAGASVTRKCDTGKGEVATKLEPGELVCPDQKAVRKYGESFKNQSWWGALTSVANSWNNTAGKAFELVGDTVSAALGSIPGVDKITAALGKAIEPAMEWIIEKLFVPPSLGYDDTGKAMGANNYDALSGAIRIAQNDTMIEGVSEDGTANGAGGRLLSSQEISAITNDYTKEEQEMIAKSSSTPAFLNPRVKGSLTQQLALMAPTSTKTLTTLPSRLLGIITPKTASVSAATASNINPFGLPISGYTDSDGVFNADPKVYTEEYCTASAKAREDSFTHSKEVGISVYTKSDPCALEKMVVGAELVSNGVSDDKYSLKDPLASITGGATGAGADLSVMTYNIRRDALTDSSGRNGLVVNTIKTQQPDIIGFQEMDQVQLTAISDALPQYAKTSDRLGDTRRIFWNKEKFKKVRDGTWNSAKTEGSNTMPWVELEANGTSFYVFNLHTQPGTGEVNTKLRAADGKKLIDDVIPSATNNDGKAVIVTGDMNSGYPGHKGTRSTEFYSAFTKNKTFDLAINLAEKKTGDRCETAHSFGSQDCGKNNARHIDHIYISNNVKPTVSSWKNIADDTTKNASDHNPVIANISIPGLTANNGEVGGPALVTTDGYAFPVALSGLQSGITLNQTKSTHWGGYAGFDLMSKDNTAVYAITDGDIVKVNRSYTFNGGPGKPCEAITFKSKDGYYYWYGHVINSTTKTAGIKAGEKIAEVAGKSYGALCNGGGPHLHIDRNKSLSLAGSKGDPSFIPQLSKIYEAAGGK
jgi:endonuclease/exonuclease/phosphatase family metal-dependent hydrolase